LKLCETQQTPQNVGFRSSTQPTHFYFLGLTEPYWELCDSELKLEFTIQISSKTRAISF